jgi:hypothetical protein
MKKLHSVLLFIFTGFGLKSQRVKSSIEMQGSQAVQSIAKTLKKEYLFLFLILSCTFTGAIAAEAPRVLYLYGDVAADGTVPSGDKETFHQMRLNDTGNRGMSGFAESIRELGFQIEEAYDQDVVLTPEFLASIDVLILGSNQRRFTAAEAKAVNEWVRSGGGLLGWSDSAFGGHWKQVGVDNDLGRLSNNDLTVQFGMYFMTDNGAGNYLVENYVRDHFINDHDRNGGVSFRGEGVSPVRVAHPAEMLAPLQEGGLGGGLRLNDRDGELNPEIDAALAIAEVGEGRVVGVFDRNLFWNAGEGTRLSHEDNREFTQRITAWAAGLESAMKALKTIQSSPQTQEISEKPEVSPRVEIDAHNRSILLIVDIEDTDGATLTPDVEWKSVRGPGLLQFANNNPYGPQIHASYETPGEYVIRVEVKGDGYFIHKQLSVDLP